MSGERYSKLRSIIREIVKDELAEYKADRDEEDSKWSATCGCGLVWGFGFKCISCGNPAFSKLSKVG